MNAPFLSARCAISRSEADLAGFVPDGVASVLDCTGRDPALWHALKAKGVGQITSLSNEHGKADHHGDLPTLAAAGGPLDGAAFTVVISDGDLPHYRNPEPYLEAARRVLVPGGLLVLCTPNIQYHRAVHALAEQGWTYETEGAWSRENLRFFTAVELKRLVAAHGFEALRSVPLRSDAPEDLPLDAQGFARVGRVTLGPLSPSEHRSFLAADMVCLAIKPAW